MIDLVDFTARHEILAPPLALGRVISGDIRFQLWRQPARQIGEVPARQVIVDLGADLATEMRARVTGRHLNDAGRRISAEQCALRSLQDGTLRSETRRVGKEWYMKCKLR